MEYDIFSTENADYVVRLGFHKPSSITPEEILILRLFRAFKRR
ncbi:MAG: hypothetical protein Q8N99_08880 [Nanoarchaeota archaeon]|nr:hypothetical protein [Nanoarchaeota archaeon]